MQHHHSQHRQVQLMEANKTIYISLLRSEIENLQSKYEAQLDDWKKQCKDNDQEVADLKEQITKLRIENKRHNER